MIRYIFKSVLLASVLLMFIECSQKKQEGANEAITPYTSITNTSYGKLPNGEEVTQYTLTNNQGMEMKVITYGGIITALKVPDRKGNLEDIVLGYDNLRGYLNKSPYFGALIGRYGNRIAKGQFRINGEVYTLSTNNGVNHLHGGDKGFDKVVWNVIDTFETPDSVGLVFRYVSPDGEEGYPGELTSTVRYIFTSDALTINYEATTNKSTIINLTQHTYFNLSGDLKEDISDHKLQLHASTFLPVDSTLIPTDELRPVKGTPFDFTKLKTIGKDINRENQQLTYGKGYDHCWVLDGGQTVEPRKVGELFEPNSGRLMEIFTTEPGIQFYSGNFLDGSITGKDGKVYDYRHGLALETQHFPNSPNEENFPDVVLNPGDTYKTTTVYQFSLRP